jgi:YD repeat-containing protein
MDVSTGLYIREDDDLIVPTPMPMTLRRTYLSGDHISRQFGVGAMHPGEWWLSGGGDERVSWADLILTAGSRIHFTRISPGDTMATALLRHNSTPTPFNGALLGWNGALWEMRLPDRSVVLFLDCPDPRDVCSIVERRDGDGHRIEYIRDASGALIRMQSEGQSIAFDYDARHRIVRASDTQQRAVVYAYDDRGRLTRAAGWDGSVRTYGYNDRDELIAIRDPGRIIENEFDAAGRLAKQVVKNSENDRDPYVMTFQYTLDNNSVVETDVGEDDGTTTVYRFNTNHYFVSEMFDAKGPAPITFRYNRDASSNVADGITLSCLGPAGPVTRMVPLAAELDDDAKGMLIREACARRR